MNSYKKKTKTYPNPIFPLSTLQLQLLQIEIVLQKKNAWRKG